MPHSQTTSVKFKSVSNAFDENVEEIIGKPISKSHVQALSKSHVQARMLDIAEIKKKTIETTATSVETKDLTKEILAKLVSIEGLLSRQDNTISILEKTKNNTSTHCWEDLEAFDKIIEARLDRSVEKIIAAQEQPGVDTQHLITTALGEEMQPSLREMKQQVAQLLEHVKTSELGACTVGSSKIMKGKAKKPDRPMPGRITRSRKRQLGSTR